MAERSGGEVMSPISKEVYFMALAYLTARMSKDPSTQCGAVIANSMNRVVGVGYNGFPNRCKDKGLPWERTGPFLESKYAYVVHAEPNAIYNANSSVEGCVMYTTLFPCNECAKTIIQSGIYRVVYAEDKYHDEDFSVAARRLFKAAGIRTAEFTAEKVINLRDMAAYL